MYTPNLVVCLTCRVFWRHIRWRPGGCARCRRVWPRSGPTRRSSGASSRAGGGRWRRPLQAGWCRCDLHTNLHKSVKSAAYVSLLCSLLHCLLSVLENCVCGQGERLRARCHLALSLLSSTCPVVTIYLDMQNERAPSSSPPPLPPPPPSSHITKTTAPLSRVASSSILHVMFNLNAISRATTGNHQVAYLHRRASLTQGVDSRERDAETQNEFSAARRSFSLRAQFSLHTADFFAREVIFKRFFCQQNPVINFYVWWKIFNCSCCRFWVIF